MMAPKSLAARLPHGVPLDDGWLLLSTPRPWFWPGRVDVGCVWRVIPRSIETCPETGCIELAQAHMSLLRGLPVGAGLQVIALRTPTNTIPAWEALRTTASPLVQAQRRHLRQGMPYGRGRDHGGLYAWDTYVTVRLPLPGVQLPEALGPILRYGAAAERQGARQRLQAVLTPRLQEAAGYRSNAADLLRQAGHTVEALSSPAIGQVVAQVLDPLGDAPLIDGEQEVRHQVMTRELTADGEGWHSATTGTAVLTMHRPAPQTYPGILCAPRAPDGAVPLALWEAWDGPLAMVVNVEVVDQGKTLAGIRRRRALAFRQRFKFFGAVDPENTAMEKEFVGILDNVYLSLENLYSTTTHLVLYGPPVQVAGGTQLVRSAASRMGLEFLHERGLGATLFLQTLPLGFDPTWPPPGFLARHRLLPGTNVSHLLPLYGGTRGNATAAIAYLNRRGEAVTWAPVQDGLAMHGLVDGKTGAGKSYAMAHLVNQVLPLGSRVVILDQLPSYKELCAYHKGDYYEMDFNEPVCLNPFFGPLDKEHQAFATAVVAEMLSGDRPITQERLGVLSDAMGYFMSTWDRARGEPRLGVFDEEVLRDGVFSPQDRRARTIALDLSRQLRMFTGHGHLAGFVDGQNTFRIERNLTVIELSKLSEFKQLQGIILFITLHLLVQFFQDPALAGIVKYFIGDESWAMLKHQATADVSERIVRTARKLLVSAWFLSQRGRDFDGPVGQVIAANTDIKLFCWQSPQEITQLRRIVELTDTEVVLARQARRRPGWASAFLRLPDDQGGLVHLVADQSTDWLVGQTVAHRAARQAAGTLDAAFDERESDGDGDEGPHAGGVDGDAGAGGLGDADAGDSAVDPGAVAGAVGAYTGNGRHA